MHRTFISMTWTPDVDAEDVQVMIRTIEDVYNLVRRQFGRPGQFDPLPTVRIFGAWAIPNLPPNAAYSNIGWYVQRSLDSTNKFIVGSRYLETVVLEPWQATSPHFDLAMTGMHVLDDLQNIANRPTPGLPKALGVSERGLFALVSTLPFKDIESQELRKLALRHAIAHYFGSLMNIPRKDRPESITEVQGDLFCTNTCAMRYTDTSTLALSFAQQELATGTLLCEHCQRDMGSQIAGFHYGMN
jgi:hypothetical protein